MSGAIVFYALSYGPATLIAIATLWLALRSGADRRGERLRPIYVRSERERRRRPR